LRVSAISRHDNVECDILEQCKKGKIDSIRLIEFAWRPLRNKDMIIPELGFSENIFGNFAIKVLGFVTKVVTINLKPHN